MIHKLTAICIFLLLSQSLFAQANFSTEKKFYFFKVWGFLKYDHPALATGKIDADSVFLNTLPAVDAATSQVQFNHVMLGLLKQLNGLVKLTPARTTANVKKLTQNVDWNWYTKDKFLTIAVSRQLLHIYQNRYTDSLHYYYTPRQHGEELPHEKPYSVADSLNVPYAYRMLAVAKIQAAVDLLYPHKYLMDGNWNVIVKKAIPLFVAANSRLAYETELLKLTAPINDTHALHFYEGMKNKRKILRALYFPPFDYTLINNGSQILVTKIIISELCEKAGIKPGDVVTHMNGQPVTQRIAWLQQYLSASNKNALLQRLNRYLGNLLFVTDSLQGTITYQRQGMSTTTTIEWVTGKQKEHLQLLTNYVNQKAAPLYKGLELDYMTPDVIRFKTDEEDRFLYGFANDHFKNGIDSVFNIAAKSKGLVFDMRGYPNWGGFINMLYNKFGQNKEPYAQYFKVNKEDFSTYSLVTDLIEYIPPTVKPGHTPYNGKVVIITNGETLSMSEYNTMFLQHLFPNSITIGEQSAGADGDTKGVMLPGGYNFVFTGNAIFYPDGTQTQHKGVKINQVIHPKVEDLLQGEDTMLKRAVELINAH